MAKDEVGFVMEHKIDGTLWTGQRWITPDKSQDVYDAAWTVDGHIPPAVHVSLLLQIANRMNANLHTVTEYFKECGSDLDYIPTGNRTPDNFWKGE